MSDYYFWRLMYERLPLFLVNWLFYMYTTVQLYYLGTKYLVVELRRKFSDTSIRKLGSNEPDIPNKLPAGHVSVITGGQMGIGFSLAKQLYQRGSTVVVSSFGLSPAEQKKVSREIRDTITISPSHDDHHHSAEVYVWNIDLRDFASVCQFATRLRTHFDHLDLLVNNAGVMYVPQGYTVDGFETHYQVNYLSHALLTWLLLPALCDSGRQRPARIVNVSSSTHYARDLFIEDLCALKTVYSPYHAYAQSKLCIVMFTYYLAQLLQNAEHHRTNSGNQREVLINSVHPGVANTRLYQHVWWVNLFPKVAQTLFRSADQGAETLLYAALSNEIHTSGHYFEDCRSVRSSTFSYQHEMQNQLANITSQQLNDTVGKFNKYNPTLRVPMMFDRQN